MARKTTLKPKSPGGVLLHAFLIETFGSVGAAARAANLPELTVRRYLYSPPKRPMLCVVEALTGLGAERSWLPGQAV